MLTHTDAAPVTNRGCLPQRLQFFVLALRFVTSAPLHHRQIRTLQKVLASLIDKLTSCMVAMLRWSKSVA